MPVPLRAVTVPVVVTSTFCLHVLEVLFALIPKLLPVISWPFADWVKVRFPFVARRSKPIDADAVVCAASRRPAVSSITTSRSVPDVDRVCCERSTPEQVYGPEPPFCAQLPSVGTDSLNLLVPDTRSMVVNMSLDLKTAFAATFPVTVTMSMVLVVLAAPNSFTRIVVTPDERLPPIASVSAALDAKLASIMMSPPPVKSPDTVLEEAASFVRSSVPPT